MKTPLLLPALLCAALAAPALAVEAPDEPGSTKALTESIRSARIGGRAPADATGAAGVIGRPVAPSPTGSARTAVVAEASSWVLDTAADAGLSQAARDQGYRIFSQPDPRNPGEKEYKVVTPAGFLPPKDERTFGGVRNLRGVDHYVVWETQDGHAAYQDLFIKAQQQDTHRQVVQDFATVAQFAHAANGGGRFASVRSQDGQSQRLLRGTALLSDALKTFLGYSQPDIRLVTERLRQQVGEGEFVVYGATRNSVVIAPGTNVERTVQIFPTVAGTASSNQ
jgi:hypothetical protein